MAHLTKAERREMRRARQKSPLAPVHDRKATSIGKGVIPAVCEVPDPYDDAGGKITVVRNLRGDTLAYLRDRKQIEEHQYIAGRHWQRIYEASTGTVPAMDTTKEPVDGGAAVSDGLTDKRRVATKALLAADLVLKPERAYIMRHIAGTGITLAQAASNRGISAKTMGIKFRECLDLLAVEFGYADRKMLTLPVKRG